MRASSVWCEKYDDSILISHKQLYFRDFNSLAYAIAKLNFAMIKCLKFLLLIAPLLYNSLVYMMVVVQQHQIKCRDDYPLCTHVLPASYVPIIIVTTDF